MLGQEEAAPDRRARAANNGCSLFHCKKTKRGWAGAEGPSHLATPNPLFINTAGHRTSPSSKHSPHFHGVMCPKRNWSWGNSVVCREAEQEEVQPETLTKYP